MSYAYLAATPGLNYNYSLYAVPVGWLVSMVPLWWAIGVSNTTTKGAFNNAMPKESWATLKAKLPEAKYRKVIRAVAANDNSHINLPFFAAGLAVANAAHVESASLHFWAGAYILFRIAYNFAYILIESPRLAVIRSLTYFAGVISTLALFVKAAEKYRSVPW